MHNSSSTFNSKLNENKALTSVKVGIDRIRRITFTFANATRHYPLFQLNASVMFSILATMFMEGFRYLFKGRRCAKRGTHVKVGTHCHCQGHLTSFAGNVDSMDNLVKKHWKVQIEMKKYLGIGFTV
jgi:hypothetical protein